MDEIMTQVHIQIDLHCKWERTPPTYRLYVNDELFCERTYIWQAGEYLSENLLLEAPSGNYTVSVETPSDFNFKLRNLRCTHGNAQIIDNETFRI